MTVLITVVNSLGEHEFCDERCYNAKGKKCDCVCGGVNHGKGLSKAIKNTIEISRLGKQDGREWIYAVQLEMNFDKEGGDNNGNSNS